MMCYRDMTFCQFYKDCAKADDCHRPLTPDVHAKAIIWAERSGLFDNAPIAIFMVKPECHEQKVEGEDK